MSLFSSVRLDFSLKLRFARHVKICGQFNKHSIINYVVTILVNSAEYDNFRFRCFTKKFYHASINEMV